jgi:hypothetical protein
MPGDVTRVTIKSFCEWAKRAGTRVRMRTWNMGIPELQIAKTITMRVITLTRRSKLANGAGIQQFARSEDGASSGQIARSRASA